MLFPYPYCPWILWYAVSVHMSVHPLRTFRHICVHIMAALISRQIGREAFLACEVLVCPYFVGRSPAMQWMANDGQLPKQRKTDDAHDGHDHDLLVISLGEVEFVHR